MVWDDAQPTSPHVGRRAVLLRDARQNGADGRVVGARLHNPVHDPDESSDLATMNPERTAWLEIALNEWQGEVTRDARRQPEQ